MPQHRLILWISVQVRDFLTQLLANNGLLRLNSLAAESPKHSALFLVGRAYHKQLLPLLIFHSGLVAFP